MLGITTIGELAQVDAAFLQNNFGRSYSRWLQEVSHGIDERLVVKNAAPKLISRETTFERNLHVRNDRPVLAEIFTGLGTDLAKDLQRRGYAAQTISIKVRYEDFHTITRDITLSFPAADAIAIRQAAEKFLRRTPLKRKLRLLGVRASSLSSGSKLQSMGMAQQAELPLTVPKV